MTNLLWTLVAILGSDDLVTASSDYPRSPYPLHQS